MRETVQNVAALLRTAVSMMEHDPALGREVARVLGWNMPERLKAVGLDQAAIADALRAELAKLPTWPVDHKASGKRYTLVCIAVEPLENSQ